MSFKRLLWMMRWLL